MSLTVSGGTVVTMDPRQPLLEVGTVIVEDGRIVDVVAGTSNGRETLDARGRVVLPGLVNAHAHALEGLFRGSGDGLGLLPWIRRTHALMDQLDRSGAAVAARLAAAEMLRAGTTAYLDPEVPTDDRFDGIVAGLEASRIRAGVTLLIEDRGGYHDWSARPTSDLTTAEIERLDGWPRDGRISPFLGPSVLSATSLELGQAVAREAGSRGIGIAFHCAEVEEDLADSLDRIGGSPVAFAAAAGLLGPRTALTHGIHFDAGSRASIAAAGSTVVHCPTSNAKLGSGIAPLREMLDAGIDVALGTDGAACNDTYDLFAEMRTAALLQRARLRDAAAIAPETVLEMATSSGARALGLAAGRLAPGRLADLVVVDLRRLGTWPSASVVDTLVFGASRTSVVDVLVGGEPAVRDGTLVGTDVDRLLADGEEVARDAMRRAGLDDDVPSRWAPAPLPA